MRNLTKDIDIKKVAIIGTGAALLVFGLPKLINYFRGSEDNSSDGSSGGFIDPGSVNGISTAASAGAAAAKQNESKVNIDQKLKLGSKGEDVTKIQIAINKIAFIRSTREFKDPFTGNVIKFPISLDKVFGKDTDTGCKYAFKEVYTSKGYITVRLAREQWARTAGFYKKPFPSELVGVSNYSDLLKIYTTNKLIEGDPTKVEFSPGYQVSNTW